MTHSHGTRRAAGIRAGQCRAGQSEPEVRTSRPARLSFDSENLRPARMFVSVISCSAILLVRIACSRPQSSAFFPPGQSRRARVSKFSFLPP
ncbi:unnamed protein product [Nesidiocoris tenuis]|uniref:Uncharacterized protein n=1 Tax=Nesidiocoris tenuis TaxID=355587 RepID=A0A6H5GC86_9HEMI|nr:unnamed protein product [Nesidiocoris tenuis]